MLAQTRAIANPQRYATGSRVSARARYTLSGVVLGSILALTSFIDLLSRIKLGPISANGFLTVLYGAMAILLLLLRRNFRAMFYWPCALG